jgi:F-type H+-transporting ATPase subunit alpha
MFGQDIAVKAESDATMLGGAVVFADGKIYDLSYAALLEQLKGDLRGKRQKQAATGTAAQDKKTDAVFAGLSANGPVPETRVGAFGKVSAVHDDVVHIDGLGGVQYGELLAFQNGGCGLAMELREDSVGAVLLTESADVITGMVVRGTGHVADIGVGDALLGRIISPLGEPLDGKSLKTANFRPLEAPAPSIMDRAPVRRPLLTGLLAIDAMIPIGRGQRELIIGDRQTGKTAIALSAMLNQKGDADTLCVYVAIGQKASTVAQVVRTLEQADAMSGCVVVAATADDRASLQYLAPYAGCAIAEDFMRRGKDVLIIYDDLSKHAQAYRSMSLLLRRPSGREAYPGDVFYLHARLLERAAQLSEERGGGSMTALPIIETMAGDISAYIPTNLISITDGQIFLDAELFHAGLRPAVDVGLSVSRVGRAAQTPAMRDVSGSLRLNLAQYRDTAIFAQFGADIDASTRSLLDKGERLTQLLKQRQDAVMDLAEQVSALVAFTAGIFTKIDAKDVAAARQALLDYLHQQCDGTLHAITRAGKLSASDREMLVAYGKHFLQEQLRGA